MVVINGFTVKITGLLGEGGYAYVYSATRGGDATNNRCAAKRFIVRDADVLVKILKEIDLHKSLSPNPYIVNYVDHQRFSNAMAPAGRVQSNGARSSMVPSEEDIGSSGEVWLLMELGVDSLKRIVDERLSQHDSASTKPPFERREIMKILSDLCHGLAHLHGQKPAMAHHDVKLENVVLGANKKYKLCDFGSIRRTSVTCHSAAQVNRADSELDQTMTLLYRAPEACDLWQGVTVDTQADMWALGVILYVLLMGKMPFDANPRQILANQYQPLPAALKDSEEFGPLVHLLTHGLLVVDPNTRIDVVELSARLHSLDAEAMPTPIVLPEGSGRRSMEPMF